MNYLSKLIVIEWIKTFLFSFLILVLLSMTGDIINGLLRNKDTINLIFLNYFIKLPSLLSKILPISSLIATLFTFNKLKGQSELIAILAAGYSPKKIYTLILTLSAFVGGLQFYNVAILDPIANKNKIEVDGSSSLKTKLSDGKIWYKGLNYVASFSGFDKKDNILYDLDLFYHNEKFQASNIFHTNKVVFITENDWIINSGNSINQLDGEDFPLVNILKDLKIKLSESINDFKQLESEISTLNIFELISYINRIKSTGLNINSYLIIFFDKFSLSLICIIFALFPLSTIFEPNRRSSSFGKNVVFTLVFTILFWMIYSSSLALGNKGKLTPFIATHIIPIIFVAHILFVFYKRKKL